MKEQLMKAAHFVLSEKGLHFTMSDIAAAAKTSRKTVYHYFQNRDHLLETVIQESLSSLLDQTNSLLQQTDLDAKEKLVRFFQLKPLDSGNTEWIAIDLADLKPYCWEKVLHFQQQRLLLMQNLLEQGIQNGLFRPCDTKITAAIILRSYLDLHRSPFWRQEQITKKEAFPAFIDFFLHGVCAVSQ
ncbi:TetR/AcrR family transcriptional regulator [Anaeroarcus burkinensis]|uniref:TetR/AcrR family transcriptional regulator n=1 Tax=Anaeroarcus burkinensis TaxID=82376 RepID=UPI000423C133|nr:TetR/AcrR family transcriptional regulator [Anaeroarcus burkinensis]